MKIAFINFYQNQVKRGAETYVFELSRRLAKSNEVKVFSGEKEHIDWAHKDSSGKWPRFIFVDYWSLMIAKFTLKVLPEIFKERYDVVIPLNGGWQAALVRITTWIYGGRMVVSGQSGAGWDDRNNLWCFPDVFVALSTRALKWAKAANPFVKVIYIPNGTDLRKFKPNGNKFRVNLEKPIVLAAGAFTKQKRLDLAIRAVARLKNASLLIAGSGGDMQEELKELGRKLLGKRFEMVTLDYKKMPEVYRSADAFTLPSKSAEAFGNVLVEAMATNLPVVATEDSVRDEIVGKAGILVNPTNVKEYANAINEVLDKKWGNAPRKQAEKFSWDKISHKYNALFKIFKEEK